MSELKPCPKCGSANVGCKMKAFPEVECMECGYSDGTMDDDWNTRPLEDAKDVEIQRLNGMLDEVRAWQVKCIEPLIGWCGSDFYRELANILAKREKGGSDE